MAAGPRRQARSAASTAPRSSRQTARHSINYRESSSESDEEGNEDVADYEPPKKSKIPPSATSVRQQRQAELDNSDSDEQILYEQFPRKRQLLPLRRKSPIKNAMSKSTHIVDVDRYSAGVIPPWQTLPYHILLQIFYYASSPLVDERTFNQTSNWSWLLRTSKLCRAFSEPALTILYRSPCLTPMDRAHTYDIDIPNGTKAM